MENQIYSTSSNALVWAWFCLAATCHGLMFIDAVLLLAASGILDSFQLTTSVMVASP